MANNITPEMIKIGVSINNVVGTYEGKTPAVIGFCSTSFPSIKWFNSNVCTANVSQSNVNIIFNATVNNIKLSIYGGNGGDVTVTPGTTVANSSTTTIASNDIAINSNSITLSTNSTGIYFTLWIND